MQKVLNYFVVFTFGVILCTPILNDSFKLVSFQRKDENRKFHDSLSISINRLDNFPKDFEDYMSDNFSFRSPLISLSKYIKLNCYQVSPDKNEIIIGKKDRFFIAGDHQAIYEGIIPFGQTWLDSLEGEWVKRKQYLDSLGIPVRILFAPMAHEIYPEELPINVVKRKCADPITLATNRLNKRFPNLVFNPIPLIKAKKKSQKMYYNLDNHWTENGGFLVGKELLKEIKQHIFPELDLSPLRQFTWKKDTRNFGHFAKVLATDKIFEDILLIDKSPNNIEIIPPLKLDFNKVGVSENDQQTHYKLKSCKNKLRVLVIRDSFGGALMPPLSACFCETVMIFDSWSYRLNKSVINKFKPDLIIYITYEQKMRSYTNPVNWEN